MLDGHLFYFRPKCISADLVIIFEADDELAKEITEKFHVDVFSDYCAKRNMLNPVATKPLAAASFDHPRNRGKAEKLKCYDGYCPTTMCRYSPIVEMISKRTDSSHIENFDLVKIQPDWIDGALEISRYCLDFYKDPDKYCFHGSHPSKSFRSLKKYYDEDPKKFREKFASEGMTEDHTIEQWCEISWERIRLEQISMFEKLIEMYSGKSDDNSDLVVCM
jgi:hypothetical protein